MPTEHLYRDVKDFVFPEYMHVYNHHKPSNLVLTFFLEGKVSIFWLSLIVQHLGTHFGSGIYDHLWLTLTCMYTCGHTHTVHHI